MNSPNPLLPIVLAFALSGPAFARVPPAPIDPCTLLTAGEVSAVVGRPVEPGRFTANGVTRDGANSTTCLWSVALPPGVAPDPARSLGGRSFAILNVMNWPGGAADAGKFLDGFRTAFKEHDIDSNPVAVDVGADEALWWGDGVAARRNGVSFGISVAVPDRPTRRAKAETLARLVVRRLARRPR